MIGPFNMQKFFAVLAKKLYEQANGPLYLGGTAASVCMAVGAAIEKALDDYRDGEGRLRVGVNAGPGTLFEIIRGENKGFIGELTDIQMHGVVMGEHKTLHPEDIMLLGPKY